MFWDNFYKLCLNKGSKPNPVAKELGISSATLTKWKDGTLPNLSTVIDIAEYFHITIDELVNGPSSKCSRCGYQNNASFATYCKKCGEILHNNFCTNESCDADGKNKSSGSTILPDDCEYCPYCGSESSYKREGVFDKIYPDTYRNIVYRSENIPISEKERDMFTLFNKLSLENKIKAQHYMIELSEMESVAADKPLKKTGTDNLGK